MDSENKNSEIQNGENTDTPQPEDNTSAAESPGMNTEAGQQAGNPTPETSSAGTLSKDDKTWGMLCHLSALSGFIIPFGNIIAPLIIWLIKKEESEFVDYNGKESLNFQISLTIYSLISAVLTIILIGFVMIVGILILYIVMTIIAGVKANNGERYVYPFTIRIIK